MASPFHDFAHRGTSSEDSAWYGSLLLLPPELLELVLSKLSPRDLCHLAASCHRLHELACNERFWRTHVRTKWGRLTPYDNPPFLDALNVRNGMRLYSLMEQGRIHIPVQIFNCEQNVGCLLSAYNARVRHVPAKGVFYVEYIGRDRDEAPEPDAKGVAEDEHPVSLERLRPVLTVMDPHCVYESDDLLHANVGEHVEVQWRFHQDMPFIWWFGTISHMPSCRKVSTESFRPEPVSGPECACSSGSVVCIHFRQFGVGHLWRMALMDRNRRGEDRFARVGMGGQGFVGGVKLIRDPDVLADWLRFKKLDLGG